MPLNFKKAQPPRSEDAPVYARTVVWDESLADDDRKIYLGETVQGVYKEKKTQVGPNKANVYVITVGEGDDQEDVQVWGSTVLNDFMENGNEGQEIPLGAVVRIINKGKPNGKSYYNFDVQFAIVEKKSALNKTPKAGPVAAKKAPKAAPVEEESSEDEDDTEAEESEESSDEDEDDFAS